MGFSAATPGGVIGSPLRVPLLSSDTHCAHICTYPVLTIPTQLPILAVLLFSTLCLFLVAEAKDLYKVRGV